MTMSTVEEAEKAVEMFNNHVSCSCFLHFGHAIDVFLENDNSYVIVVIHVDFILEWS